VDTGLGGNCGDADGRLTYFVGGGPVTKLVLLNLRALRPLTLEGFTVDDIMPLNNDCLVLKSGRCVVLIVTVVPSLIMLPNGDGLGPLIGFGVGLILCLGIGGGGGLAVEDLDDDGLGVVTIDTVSTCCA